MLPDVAIQKGFEFIDKVGVRELWIPMKWFGRDIQTRHSAYVSLEDERGAHMSRIVGVVLRCEGQELNGNREMFEGLIEEIRKTHGSRDAHWKIRWDLREPDLWWRFELEGSDMEGNQKWYLQLEFPYVTVCPCSAAMIRSLSGRIGNSSCFEQPGNSGRIQPGNSGRIEQPGIGWPHMQRCIGRIKYQVRDWDFAGILRVIEREFYRVTTKALMKREDELRWCQGIVKQEWFVEDAARILANILEKNGYKPYVVVTEHFETIHSHNVVAIKRGGLL